MKYVTTLLTVMLLAMNAAAMQQVTESSASSAKSNIKLQSAKGADTKMPTPPKGGAVKPPEPEEMPK